MLCCQGSIMSVYKQPHSPTQCASQWTTLHWNKKKEGSISCIQLATELSSVVTWLQRASVPSYTCWHTVQQQSAHIMLIMPIMPSKDFECMGTSSIPTRCVYLLLPTYNQPSCSCVFLDQWIRLFTSDWAMADLRQSHDPTHPWQAFSCSTVTWPHTPLTNLLMFATTIPNARSLLQSHDSHAPPTDQPNLLFQLVPSCITMWLEELLRRADHERCVIIYSHMWPVHPWFFTSSFPC